MISGLGSLRRYRDRLRATADRPEPFVHQSIAQIVSRSNKRLIKATGLSEGEQPEAEHVHKTCSGRIYVQILIAISVEQRSARKGGSLSARLTTSDGIVRPRNP